MRNRSSFNFPKREIDFHRNYLIMRAVLGGIIYGRTWNNKWKNNNRTLFLAPFLQRQKED